MPQLHQNPLLISPPSQLSPALPSAVIATFTSKNVNLKATAGGISTFAFSSFHFTMTLYATLPSGYLIDVLGRSSRLSLSGKTNTPRGILKKASSGLPNQKLSK